MTTKTGNTLLVVAAWLSVISIPLTWASMDIETFAVKNEVFAQSLELKSEAPGLRFDGSRLYVHGMSGHFEFPHMKFWLCAMLFSISNLMVLCHNLENFFVPRSLGRLLPILLLICFLIGSANMIFVHGLKPEFGLLVALASGTIPLFCLSTSAISSANELPDTKEAWLAKTNPGD